jgi:hypothetical protein
MWPPFTVVYSGISSSSYSFNLGTDSLGAGKNGRYFFNFYIPFGPRKQDSRYITKVAYLCTCGLTMLSLA